MAQALEQARNARLSILESMNHSMPAARENISPYAPRIITVMVDKDKIRDIIGPGGKMIRSITERTGCKIDINDDGRVDIASVDEDAAQKALDIIKELTAEAELNKTYLGKVVRVVNFGAFVEILPGVDGLLHISEIENHRIADVRDVLNEGDQTLVKVIDIDGQGKVRLSRRAAMQEKDGDDSGGDTPPPKQRGERSDRDRSDRPPRRGGRGGGRGRNDRGGNRSR
jgi:polyribonucleotide nucleotidyltransferase